MLNAKTTVGGGAGRSAFCKHYTVQPSGCLGIWVYATSMKISMFEMQWQ